VSAAIARSSERQRSRAESGEDRQRAKGQVWHQVVALAARHAQAAERAGWQVAKVYKDHGISGTRGRDKRPAFDKLRRDAARRFIRPPRRRGRGTLLLRWLH
jgi:hypothetical protein